MVSNILSYITCFGWLPLFLMGLLGFILGWLLKPSKVATGDLSAEGEGALRTENDGMRTRIADLEAQLDARTTENSDLSRQLATAGTAVGAATLATTSASSESVESGDDDETYALEWRNRYLAARVKYLEGRISEVPAAPVAAAAATAVAVKASAKKTPAKKKASAKKAEAKPAAAKKAPAKKTPAKKAVAKKAAAPKVLYTDGPTDGAPDDLKLIKGIGPKFEKDLNGKGIYYFRQIGAWKKKDVEVVEKVIDSIPGRIDRDDWVPQAKGLAKGGKPAAAKSRKKPGPKPGTKRGATNLDGTPRKKPGPKGTAKKAEAPKNEKYHLNVRKFDAKAKTATIDNIVKYCGISLRSRDSSLVACSDPTEVNTVVTNFMMKKLGVSEEKGASVVADVCAEMKSERFKNRVTFYYLCAKKARKMNVFT